MASLHSCAAPRLQPPPASGSSPSCPPLGTSTGCSTTARASPAPRARPPAGAVAAAHTRSAPAPASALPPLSPSMATERYRLHPRSRRPHPPAGRTALVSSAAAFDAAMADEAVSVIVITASFTFPESREDGYDVRRGLTIRGASTACAAAGSADSSSGTFDYDYSIDAVPTRSPLPSLCTLSSPRYAPHDDYGSSFK